MPVSVHLSPKPKLYVGAVAHSEGISIYPAWTLGEVRAKIAEYCREGWDDLPGDVGSYDGLSDMTVIDEYFGNVDGEHWDWNLFTVPQLPSSL